MVSTLDVICIDFETEAIHTRPAYPPKPVGVSIQWPKDKAPIYWAWGHPTQNNTDLHNGRRKVQEAWNSGMPLLFHHAKFDIDVAQTFLECKELPWDLYHDTLLLMFLHNPHALSFQLKASAHTLLGVEPTEQAAVRDWLVTRKLVKKNDKSWGAKIASAPGDLVGQYAQGDVTRTLKLFEVLYPEIEQRGMLSAYNRERQLMPILLQNERQGIPVDAAALKVDYATYSQCVSEADTWLRARFRNPELNIDSDVELAHELDKHGIVTDWVLTPTGKRSTSKKNLALASYNDAQIAAVLSYRARLQTCVNTFMQPWLQMAEHSNGYIYTNWNQVRQSRDDKSNKGTRTGRLSSNPNLQNIPKTFDNKDDGYVHPDFMNWPKLPFMRKYVLPDAGSVFCHRDYNQQELRILAHFEDDMLKDEYAKNPLMDIHTFVQQCIKDLVGLELERSSIKTVNFGTIYGRGARALALALGKTEDEARSIKKAQLQAIPGLAMLDRELKKIGRSGEYIKTWGGRQYYCEEPKEYEGRMRTFEYKLLNYLIQGSAADCTKEALIRYNGAKNKGRFLVTVHDEINISVPEQYWKAEMDILKQVMESVEFDVPMLTDGKYGTSWGDLQKC